MKRILFLLILGLFLSGCSAKQEHSAYRVVTGVQVRYTANGSTLERTYTKQGSMRSILTYLRILDPFGPVQPEGEFDSSCQITLQYSNGPDRVYLQQGLHYLQQDNGSWERIDPSHASLLYPLLLLLPSDT